MSTQSTKSRQPKRVKAPVETANEVRLLGRVAGEPTLKQLPSGDELVTFRVSVQRVGAQPATRQKVDSLPCSAWTARVRRSVLSWRPGDTVEVSGAVRCRFFQSARGLGSRVEVEVSSARLIRRAPAA